MRATAVGTGISMVANARELCSGLAQDVHDLARERRASSSSFSERTRVPAGSGVPPRRAIGAGRRRDDGGRKRSGTEQRDRAGSLTSAHSAGRDASCQERGRRRLAFRVHHPYEAPFPVQHVSRHAVVMAGGSGTASRPRSRQRVEAVAADRRTAEPSRRHARARTAPGAAEPAPTS